jgi:hypothetical protein
VGYWLRSSKDHGAGNEPRKQRREMHLGSKEAETKVEMKKTREGRYWKARTTMIWRMMIQRIDGTWTLYVFEFLTSRDWYRPVPFRTFALLV